MINHARTPHAEQITRWQQFYAEQFGLHVDLSSVPIPPTNADFGKLLIVARGVTPNLVLPVCRRHFFVWQKPEDVEEMFSQHDRTSEKGHYAVWLRDRIEADEEMADKSQSDLKALGIPGITLLERLLMELEYFTRTGEHLDRQSYTLCSGSYDPRDDRIPYVFWESRGRGGLMVSWYGSLRRYPYLRIRVVVS